MSTVHRKTTKPIDQSIDMKLKHTNKTCTFIILIGLAVLMVGPTKLSADCGDSFNLPNPVFLTADNVLRFCWEVLFNPGPQGCDESADQCCLGYEYNGTGQYLIANMHADGTCPDSSNYTPTGEPVSTSVPQTANISQGCYHSEGDPDCTDSGG
jgi:hypothetical protein